MYYINVDIRHENKQSNVTKKAFKEFVYHTQHKAIFRIGSSYIDNNINNLCLMYLSLVDYPEDRITTNTTSKLFDGNMEWLKQEDEDVYNKLIENGQVVVGYIMISSEPKNKPGYGTIDLIESRIKNFKIGSILISEYVNRTGVFIVPDIVTYKTEGFWLKTIIFNKCSTVDDLIDVYNKAFRSEISEMISLTCKNLFTFLDPLYRYKE